MTNGGKKNKQTKTCVSKDMGAAQCFPFVFVWFVGFCAGDFNENKQILNRTDAATEMILGNRGRKQAQKLARDSWYRAGIVKA